MNADLHEERTKMLACQHPELTLSHDHHQPVCFECKQPIYFLSDIQINTLGHSGAKP